MKGKKYYLAAILVWFLVAFSAPAFAAPTLDGILDIPWGATVQEVRGNVQSKGFGHFDFRTFQNGLTVLSCEGIYYIPATYKTMYTFDFVNDRFQWGIVEIISKDPGGAYDRLKQIFLDQYGPFKQEKLDYDGLTSADWELFSTKGDKCTIKLVDGRRRTNPQTGLGVVMVTFGNLGQQ